MAVPYVSATGSRGSSSVSSSGLSFAVRPRSACEWVGPGASQKGCPQGVAIFVQASSKVKADYDTNPKNYPQAHQSRRCPGASSYDPSVTVVTYSGELEPSKSSWRFSFVAEHAANINGGATDFDGEYAQTAREGFGAAASAALLTALHSQVPTRNMDLSLQGLRIRPGSRPPEFILGVRLSLIPEGELKSAPTPSSSSRALPKVPRTHRTQAKSKDAIKAAQEDTERLRMSVLEATSSPAFRVAFARGLRHKLPRQQPSIRPEVAASSIKVFEECPSDLGFVGGSGDPLILSLVPEGSCAQRAGLGEGFELAWCDFWDTTRCSWRKNDCVRELSLDQIRHLLQPPVRLSFRSPMANLPTFSDREIAERLGLRRVKEWHFRRLVQELKYSWVSLDVRTLDELLALKAACTSTSQVTAEPCDKCEGDDDSELCVDAGHSEMIATSAGREPGNTPADDEGHLKLASPIEISGKTLKAGFLVRTSFRMGAAPLRGTRDLGGLTLPAVMELGRPRRLGSVTEAHFRRALDRAGIRWLSDNQQKQFYSHLKGHQADGEVSARDLEEDISGGGSLAGDGVSDISEWEQELVDHFVIDSDGLYSHIERPVKPMHLRSVTKEMIRRINEQQERQRLHELQCCNTLASCDGDSIGLNFKDFQAAMVGGGITWFSREHLRVIFNSIVADGSFLMSLGDWLGRFTWDSMRAVQEVSRALRTDISRTVNCPRTMTGRFPQRKAVVVRERGLDFLEFQNRCKVQGVTWLSVEQQRLIFDTLDTDKSRCVTESELEQLVNVREQLELKRGDAVESALVALLHAEEKSSQDRARRLAAVCIEASARVLLARREASRRREARGVAATRLAGAFRGYRARRERKRLISAALKKQAEEVGDATVGLDVVAGAAPTDVESVEDAKVAPNERDKIDTLKDQPATFERLASAGIIEGAAVGSEAGGGASPQEVSRTGAIAIEVDNAEDANIVLPSSEKTQGVSSEEGLGATGSTGQPASSVGNEAERTLEAPLRNAGSEASDEAPRSIRSVQLTKGQSTSDVDEIARKDVVLQQPKDDNSDIIVGSNAVRSLGPSEVGEDASVCKVVVRGVEAVVRSAVTNAVATADSVTTVELRAKPGVSELSEESAACATLAKAIISGVCGEDAL